MSRNRLEIIGLPKLLDELRKLPELLTARGGDIVQRRGARAVERIAANYRAHRHSGNLENSLELQTVAAGRFGAGVRVRARARHAHLFEYGTVARHYGTANRGIMPPAPPHHAFVPVLESERREMYEDFAELLEEQGLEVSGRA